MVLCTVICAVVYPFWEIYIKQRFTNLQIIFNREMEIIPVNIIIKAPSAELKPDQKDTDSLPEYELLDKAGNIITQINETVKNWQSYAEEIKVKPELRDAINKTLINSDRIS